MDSYPPVTKMSSLSGVWSLCAAAGVAVCASNWCWNSLITVWLECPKTRPYYPIRLRLGNVRINTHTHTHTHTHTLAAMLPRHWKKHFSSGFFLLHGVFCFIAGFFACTDQQSSGRYANWASVNWRRIFTYGPWGPLRVSSSPLTFEPARATHPNFRSYIQ